MAAMKTAGVRELKAQLSQYLREVAAGETILVTDRGRVVAELRRPGSSELLADPAQSRYLQFISQGRARPALAERRTWVDWKGLGLARGTAQAILDAERGE